MKFLPLFLLTLLLCTLLCAPQIAAQNYKPEQIRLELTGTETEMTVIYTTGSSTNSNFKTEYLTAPKPQVWWGTTSTPSTLVGGKTNHFDYSGYIADIHAVTLKGLKPGTTYYYKVGDSSYKDGVSQVYSFKAGNPTKWAVFGDYGLTNMDQSLSGLINDAKAKVYDGVLHLGDIAYDLHNQKGAKGDTFMNSLQPVSATVPYMTIVGNHESNGNFSHFKNRFFSLEQFGAKSGSDTLLWFSWNSANVHWLVFDTEVYSYFNDPVQVQRQLDWLEKDLIKYNTPEMRQKYPWIISLGHKCDWHDECKYDDFRALLHKYGVDLHLCGHQHNYQRLYPGLRRTVQSYPSPNLFVNPSYWTQVVIGSPGCQEKISTGLAPYKNGTASYKYAYGYGLLEFKNSTYIDWVWKQTNLPASSANGETTFDQAMLAFDLPGQEFVGVNAPSIEDRMTLIQTHHGMRSMQLYDFAMANHDYLTQQDQLLGVSDPNQVLYDQNYLRDVDEDKVE